MKPFPWLHSGNSTSGSQIGGMLQERFTPEKITGDPARGSRVGTPDGEGKVVGYGEDLPNAWEVEHPRTTEGAAQAKAAAYDPDVSVAKQLEGKGQLKDLRSNPNFEGVNVEDLLSKTPRQLEQMVAEGKLSARNYRRIMKAFEGRDLGKRGK